MNLTRLYCYLHLVVDESKIMIMSELNNLTYQPIDFNKVISSLRDPLTGGMVIFSGEVRNQNKNKEVSYLEYEAYEPMAEKIISEIVAEAIERWRLNNAICIHRLGRLEITDCAVIIVTCGVHRAEAYEANRYIIDRVKEEVPIWKNEHFTDGTNEWGNNKDCKCADPKHHHHH